MVEQSRMADPLATNPEPAGGFSFKQMLPTLVIDVAMPILAFNMLTSQLWHFDALGSGRWRALSRNQQSARLG
jgi:hypothetical protein